MRKIKLYIAASLDGYIAQSDGDIDWLMEFPKPQKSDNSYKEFLESVDTVIIGGRAYQELACMDILWPYKDKNTYVVTHSPIDFKKDVNFITENVIETIIRLKEQEGKDIGLAGGGELTTMLLNSSLIDEMIITYIPVILGKGISLFPNNPKESKWSPTGYMSYDNGAHKVIYQFSE